MFYLAVMVLVIGVIASAYRSVKKEKMRYDHLSEFTKLLLRLQDYLILNFEDIEEPTYKKGKSVIKEIKGRIGELEVIEARSFTKKNHWYFSNCEEELKRDVLMVLRNKKQEDKLIRL